jgi:hypothetical protein
MKLISDASARLRITGTLHLLEYKSWWRDTRGASPLSTRATCYIPSLLPYFIILVVSAVPPGTGMIVVCSQVEVSAQADHSSRGVLLIVTRHDVVYSSTYVQREEPWPALGSSVTGRERK